MTQDIGALADAIDPRKCGRCEGTGRITVIMPNGTSIPNRTCKTCSGQGRVTPCIPPRKAAAIADALRSLTTAVEIGRTLDVEALTETVARAIEDEVWVPDDKERVRGIGDAAIAVLRSLGIVGTAA